MSRILKEAAILAGIIFVIKFVFRLIFNSDSIIETFEKGIWIGLGVYFTSFVMLFVVIVVILTIIKWVGKRKNA